MSVDPSIAAIVVGIGSALISAGSVALNLYSKRRTSEATVTNLDAKAANELAKSVELVVAPLNGRIKELVDKMAYAESTVAQMQSDRVLEKMQWESEIKRRDEIDKKRQADLDELRGGVMVLIAQLEGSGIIPRWKPKPVTGPIGAAK